jgi:fructosamine-3-kinase
MTHLFGSNSASFYSAYNACWPLPPGHELRKTVYNLYHILNHYVLFGGGYLTQAQVMMSTILKAPL